MITSIAKALPAATLLILQRLFLLFSVGWLNYLNAAIIWTLSTPPENPSLPHEVLDLIFSFLDIRSLIDCSKALKSTDLCTLATKWLYRDVLVYSGPKHHQVTNNSERRLFCISDSMFLRHLQTTSSTWLKPNAHVRTLCIMLIPASVGVRTTWSILFQPALLPCLRTLKLLSDAGRGTPGTRWGEIDPVFRKAFLDRLAWMGTDGKGGIEEAVLLTEGFPAKDLERCVGLKKLSFATRLDFEAAPSLLEPTTGPMQLRPEHLTIICFPQVDELTNWLIRSPTGCIISNLRSLNFSCLEAEDLEPLRDILEVCKDKLQDLTVNFGSKLFCSSSEILASGLHSSLISNHNGTSLAPTLASVLPMHTLPALQKLTICTTIDSSEFMIIRARKAVQTRHYRSSIRELGTFVQKKWTPTSAESRCTLEFRFSLVLEGTGAATLAEMDFEPFLRAVPVDFPSPQAGASPEPLFILKIGAIRHFYSVYPAEDISFDDILADVQKNEVLAKMIKNGQVRIERFV